MQILKKNLKRVYVPLIRNLDLNIVNDGQPTHTSGTAIDLTIVSPQLNPDITWNVHDSPLSSDHYPIIITIEMQGHIEAHHQEIFNHWKGRYDHLQQDPMWANLPNLDHDDPEKAVQDMYDLFEELAEKHIPKYIKRRFYPKPWWSKECTQLWRERERLYRKYRRTGENTDKVEWKRARAKAKWTFKQHQKANWNNYIESLKSKVSLAEVWRKVKSIRGRTPNTVHILKDGDTIYKSVSNITEKLACTLEKITSNLNYSPEFLNIKNAAEQIEIDFGPTNQEPYNKLFSYDELLRGISKLKNNAPGHDHISNMFLKAIPDTALPYILEVTNMVWRSAYYDERWRKAIIIPIAKLGKNLFDPENYRPIALLCCIAKLIAAIINTRLVEYLEMNNLLANIQSGFRKNRSTLDHLVRLDAYIRRALAKNERVVSIFFDMQKAYDKTWRYGILQDLYDCGLRGRLPTYIAQVLQNRKFQVKVQNNYSSIKTQETGIPQGSTLSVTLFAIKINSLHKVIPSDIHASLFVDDLQIAFSHPNSEIISNRLQLTMNNISSWADRNGFTFSPSKTKSLEFFHGTEPMSQIETYLKGAIIPRVDTFKFLGLIWDSKMNWRAHINHVKDKCSKSLNLLRCVSKLKWGCDVQTGLKLYRALTRSILDYGSIIYGSANTQNLNIIETIANDGLRIVSGAFRTTPVSSLRILLHEPPLEIRRDELRCKLYLKMKWFIQSQAFTSVVNTGLTNFFQQGNVENAVITKIRYALQRFEVRNEWILPHRTPKLFSFERKKPKINIDMLSYPKDTTPHQILRGKFANIVETNYSDCIVIYTDGSKTREGVGCAAVTGEHREKKLSIPKIATIMTAETYAIKLALELAKAENNRKVLICSDSWSLIQLIIKASFTEELVSRVQSDLHELIQEGFEITILFVPSHVGIPGNEKADQLAKDAAAARPQNMMIPFRDWYSEIHRKKLEIWEEAWQSEIRDLSCLKRSPKKWEQTKLSRKDEVVLNRIRLGHTRATHSYIFETDPTRAIMPICRYCNNERLSLRHVFIECASLEDQRNQIIVSALGDRELNMNNIIGEKGVVGGALHFLKDIGLFSDI